MAHPPAILKESKNPDSPLHIGGTSNFMQPLCEKLTEDEIDITGWISTRDWKPNEKFCAKCCELYNPWQYSF